MVKCKYHTTRLTNCLMRNCCSHFLQHFPGRPREHECGCLITSRYQTVPQSVPSPAQQHCRAAMAEQALLPDTPLSPGLPFPPPSRASLRQPRHSLGYGARIPQHRLAGGGAEADEGSRTREPRPRQESRE